MLAVAAELSVDEVLQRLVDSARELAGARYAALGLPDGEGGFRALPHLGHERRADRLARPAAPAARRARRDARHDGAVPHERHPRAPALPRLVARERIRTCAPSSASRSSRRTGVIGAFYLTEKLGARGLQRRGRGADRPARRACGDRDHERAPARADAGALDRRRAEPARARPPRRGEPEAVRPRAHRRGGARRCSSAIPAAAREQVAKLQALAQEALDELRSLVFELRPPDLEKDGLGGALRKHVELRAPARAAARSSSTSTDEPPGGRGSATASCSASPRRRSRTRSSTRRRSTSPSGSARDDGPARCSRSRTTASASTRRRPASRSRRLGLTSMEERARAARRHARDPLGARAPGRRCASRLGDG